VPQFLHHFFVEDPRYLAPAATCVAIVVTLLLWLFNQRRKQLSYTILWRHPLMNLAREIADRMDVRFDGQPVRDVHLVVLKIKNTGHIPINVRDYASRLAVMVGQPSRILVAEVSDTQPSYLEEREGENHTGGPLIQSVEETKVVFRPVLLNGGDSIVLQMLVTSLAGKIMLLGNIEGVTNICEAKNRMLIPSAMTYIGVIFMVAAMLLVDPKALLQLNIEEVLPYILVFLFGFVLLYAGMRIKQRAEAVLAQSSFSAMAEHSFD
jgi:hypothetical protein